MTFFNPNAPLLCRKQNVLALPDNIPGVWRCHWQLGNLTLFSTFYTQLDQACILWGVISAVIFVTAQFVPISWMTQAVWWSVLSVIGTVGMIALTPSWLKEELGWIVHSWIILMLLGVVITDLGIFLAWGEVLMNLCPLWLGLIALGYLCTGVGMRSRTLIITGLLHLLSIWILPYIGPWQFLATGIITGASSILLAEFQWDSSGACGND